MSESIQAKLQGHHICHALNGNGEQKVCNTYVDGFCSVTNTVYLFHGCFHHGCRRCFDPRVVHPLKKKPMWLIYNQTLQKDQELCDAGFEVVVMWEHEFNASKGTDPSVQHFLSTLDVKDVGFPTDEVA